MKRSRVTLLRLKHVLDTRLTHAREARDRWPNTRTQDQVCQIERELRDLNRDLQSAT
jgi:hypothetical protein